VAITVVFVAATVVLLRFYPELVFAPLLAIVGFDAFCLVDLARASEVRFMSKRAWAVVCLVSIIGGVIYLSIGRVRPQRSH
jgi:hypothetical protein